MIPEALDRMFKDEFLDKCMCFETLRNSTGMSSDYDYDSEV